MPVKRQAGRAPVKTPVPRYATTKDLKAAVRAWCIEYVTAKVAITAPSIKNPWNEHQQRHLEQSLHVSDEARELCNGMRALLTEGKAFLARNAESEKPFEDGHVNELRRAVAALGRSFVPQGKDDAWSSRVWLVVQHAKSRVWWWTDGKPTIRDLAVLSLLAGNLPEMKNRRERMDFHPTVLDTVRAEQRIVELVLKRRGLLAEVRRA